jgi:hypothetical protein
MQQVDRAQATALKSRRALKIDVVDLDVLIQTSSVYPVYRI